MMKKFFMLLALVLGATTISAQSVNKKADLVGTWQLCNMIDGLLDSAPEIKRAPYLKVFSPGGALTNLMISKEGDVFLTMEGTYEKTSDTSYVEHIKKLLVSSAMDGVDNVMKYEFLNDNLMVITFQIIDENGDKLDCQEVWERVSMPSKK
ncbi:MAG: DUF4488 domain-containing protein [Candidatus Paraprevotella stercoravium]|jgi:hypothetical protein|uniref:DUF4488 domain-containing protein n=2 Tax=Bacteroidales TaxID=171549 RepID=A0ABT7U3Z2_9BACE|nr:DUF4488 domain-containing protein [Candidatus Paraprevotella stercoravium]MDM8145235.1 DUF4488 domain-containing protein [Bacteroides eggerthii]